MAAAARANPVPDAVQTFQLRSSPPVALGGEDWVEEDIAFGGASVRLGYLHGGGLDVMSSAHMGLHCWDGAYLLCEFMASRADEFQRHQSLLELGAGPGLCGLLNAELFGGASSGRTVCLTDGHVGAVALCAKNVGAAVADEEVFVHRLRWGNEADAAALPLPSYDAIIAADCTFSEGLNPALLESAGALLAPNGGALYLSVSTRTTLLIPSIVKLCAAQGLTLREPELDAQGCPLAAPTAAQREGDGGGGWIFCFDR